MFELEREPEHEHEHEIKNEPEHEYENECIRLRVFENVHAYMSKFSRRVTVWESKSSDNYIIYLSLCDFMHARMCTRA